MISALNGAPRFVPAQQLDDFRQQAEIARVQAREAKQAALHRGSKAFDRDLEHHHNEPHETDGDVQSVAADECEERRKKGAALRRRPASDHVGELAQLETEKRSPERERDEGTEIDAGTAS